MRDEVDDVPPRFSKRLRNLLLDGNGKPYQRNGLAIWSTAQIPTGERVSGIKIFRDAMAIGSQGYRALAYSHRKAWASNAAVTEAAGPAGWTEILTPPDPGATSALSIAQNVSATTKAKFQHVDQFLYASFSNRDAYVSNDIRYHPRPRRIFALDGAYYQTTIGAPVWDEGDPTYTAQDVGSVSFYLYWFVYLVTVNSPNGETFEFRSTPFGPHGFHTGAPIDATGGRGVVISNLNRPYAGGASNIFNDPVYYSNLSIEIYRTTASGTVGKLVGTQSCVGAGPYTFTDTVPDASLGQNLYTSDGTAGYDYAPPCKSYHVVNASIGYYGGFDLGQPGSQDIAGYIGAIQSSPGVIESAPSAFLIPAPDHLTAIESVDIYPVFATRNSIWRVEGTIDAFGNGTVNLRPISERIGCIRQNAMVKTDQGLIFASDDGLYYTDGFQATKVTDHLNKYYRSWFNGFNDSALDDIAAIYHPPTKRYFYSSFQADARSYVNLPNTLHAGDLRHRTDEGGAAHSYLQGEANQTTNGISFLPTALESFRDHVFVGDGQGYITKMKVEPTDPQGADIVTSDVGVDGSVAQGSWNQYPVVWDYISPIFDLGSRAIKKWVTRLLITFKIRRNPAPQIFVQANSINDGAFTTDASNEAQPLTVIRETAVGAQRREWTVKRWFPKGWLRCNTKQVQIKKASCVLFASNPGGVRAYAQATVNAVAKTATLMSGAYPVDTQLNNLVGQSLSFANDGYVATFVISAVAGAVATLLDPFAQLVAGTYEWQAVGYPKDQAGGLESYVIGYTELAPGMQTIVPSNPTGGN